MAKRRAVLSAALVGLPVLLGSAVAAEGDGPVWVHVCTAGTYEGHPQWKRIEWTRETFDRIVQNFHAHPAYKAGPDGVGMARVIPYDYEHASEYAAANPTAGSVPSQGAPAAGWALECQVRQSATGEAELWVLSEFSSTAREQIRAGGYQWTSVAVVPKYRHHVTGEDQGPTLTSVALTNHPFIQGMAPIAAAAAQWGRAESPEEFAIGIRGIFGLDESADISEVPEQMMRLAEMVRGGAVPEHLEEEVRYMLYGLRDLLGLPKLASQEEILGGAETALEGLLSGQGSQTAPPEESTMALPATLTAIAAVVRCNSTDEQKILQAVQEKAQDAEKVEAAEDALDAVGKLTSLFGSKDITDLMAQAADAVSRAEKLKPTLDALSKAQEALKGQAEGDAENEAEAVAASLAHDDVTLAKRFKPVVLQARLSCINDDGTVDPAKLEKFRQDYPLEEERRALLTRSVVAGANGVQLGSAATGYGGVPITQGAGGAPQQGGANADIVAKLNAQPGRNPVEKANALLLSARPAHKDLPYLEQCRAAGELVRDVMSDKPVTL